MTRRDFTSFEEFEYSGIAGRDEVVTVITENDWIKSDLMTNCKNLKTALRRFFKALDPENNNPAFYGWHEAISESCENGYFTANDSVLADGSRNEFPSWAYGVEQIDDGRWYIFLNVFVGKYEKPITKKETTTEGEELAENEEEVNTMTTENTTTTTAAETAETEQQKTDRENRERCKRIADDLEAVAEGRVYKCPECGELVGIENLVYDEDTQTWNNFIQFLKIYLRS